MSLIGILTEKKNESYIRQGIKNIVSEEQIFFLKESSIKNLKNIKFQTILLGKKIEQNKEQTKEIIKKCEYLIFNSDIPENLNLLNNFKIQLINYGFNSKATITTSSVENKKMLVCLQRAVKTPTGDKIEPQEIQIQIPDKISNYAVMELTCLKLLYKEKSN